MCQSDDIQQSDTVQCDAQYNYGVLSFIFNIVVLLALSKLFGKYHSIECYSGECRSAQCHHLPMYHLDEFHSAVCYSPAAAIQRYDTQLNDI